MKLRYTAGLVSSVILAACSEEVGSGEDRTDDELNQSYFCDQNCVVDVFKEYSKIPRPSFGEEGARAWVRQKVEDARSRWGSEGVKLTVEEDLSTDAANHKIINQVVRVPGTGRFKSRLPVILQAHHDIVYSVKDAPPGAPLDPFYENGVDVVSETIGGLEVLHSRDFKTTLGADDGVGVAQMVRYILDPSLVHPPLELVFTAAEEAGLVGAQRFDARALPLKGAAMISLDASSSKDPLSPNLASPLAIVVGANGGVTSNLDGKLPASSLEAGAKVLELKLTGLKGGHSGTMIHLARMNSIKAFGAILERVATLAPGVRLVDVTVGEVDKRRGSNKIPNSFVGRIALESTTDVGALQAATRAFFAEYAQAYSDEIQANVKFDLVEVQASTQDGALSPQTTAAIVNAIKDIPNGPLVRGGDSPNKVESSSNIGVFGVAPSLNEKSVFFSFAPRAYVLDTAQQTSNAIREELDVALASGGIKIDGQSYSKLEQSAIVPWLVPGEAKVVQLARGVGGRTPLIKDSFKLAGGTEPGEFMKRFPQLKDRVIGMGPALVDAHTPRESVGLESFKQSTVALHKIIYAWASDPALLMPQKDPR